MPSAIHASSPRLRRRPSRRGRRRRPRPASSVATNVPLSHRSPQRREHVFQLQPVLVREEDGVVAAAAIVLRVLGGGVEHVGLTLHQEREGPKGSGLKGQD